MDLGTAREIALREFDGEEYDHFDKPAYRVRPARPGGKPGKTFMTLWLDLKRAVLMLDVEQQSALCARYPEGFLPHPSKWGAKGATFVDLGKVNADVFRMALAAARRNAEPRRK